MFESCSSEFLTKFYIFVIKEILLLLKKFQHRKAQKGIPDRMIFFLILKMISYVIWDCGIFKQGCRGNWLENQAISFTKDHIERNPKKMNFEQTFRLFYLKKKKNWLDDKNHLDMLKNF